MKIVSPSVVLLDYNPNALELLLLTKATRLHGQQTLEDIKRWPYEKKLEELSYMHDTIKSSWEFSHYIFQISNCSRIFTHQFVRTRTMGGVDDPAFGQPSANPAVASFAQEAQRTIDPTENGCVIPSGAKNPARYEVTFKAEFDEYKQLIESGENFQDARYALPNAIATSIIVKLDLRVLSDMANVRLCFRSQGEYQKIFRQMRAAVYDVHPWAKGWIECYCVNNGTCCFPRYGKCPIQGSVFDPRTGHSFNDGDPARRTDILRMWEDTEHEANPVAIEGRTM